MFRTFNIAAGLSLTLFGGLLITYNILGGLFRLPVPTFWQLWPLTVGGLGLLLSLPPLIAPRQRVLGALFIPGAFLLALCGVGLMGTFGQTGRIWGAFWPMLLIALALGLALAALYLRVIWLLIPAFILGLMGAAFQFSALTGLWGAWAVLWTTAPLGVGLALAFISLVRRSVGLFIAGGILVTAAVVMALSMTALLTGQWSIIGLLMGLGLIVTGGLLIWLSVWKDRRPTPAAPANT